VDRADVNDGGVILIRPMWGLPSPLRICTPRASIDGWDVNLRWRQGTPVAVTAGHHQVVVWTRWLTWPRYGHATVTLEVAVGETVAVDWTAPDAVWSTGKIWTYPVAPEPAAAD